MASRCRAPAHVALCGIAAACAIAIAPPVVAQAGIAFRIAPQPLGPALRDFGLQAGVTILADAALTRGKRTAGYAATADPETALGSLLRGSGLTYRHRGGVFVIVRGEAIAAAPDPPPVIQDIIVTAQKREQKIQDVPIAITALSAQALDRDKIEGGPELLRAVPNVAFSKNNFSGFNFSIRGIGTKAVSVTTDPAVAISYNNVPLIRNRLFEQEYFDVDRIEVLRGPQGTLYGRNATAGVVNMITNKPDPSRFDGELRGEIGNYATRRLRGFFNLPVTDRFAIRIAGATTRRDGFDYNSITDRRVNGRDLWQTRVSALWQPDDRTDIGFVWEHFGERDNRSRTGKQLCDRDPGPTSVGGVAVTDPLVAGQLSQGCRETSLFAPSAFGTPNGLSLPIVIAGQQLAVIGVDPAHGFDAVNLLTPGVDPYGGLMQSRNLREIASIYDPRFTARNDVFELKIDREIAPGLKLFSQSSWSTDHYYSTQDYNRFNTVPIFNSSSALSDQSSRDPLVGGGVTPGGIFIDPQLGPSNRLLGVDLDDSTSTQFYQEIRLQSSLAGRLNFSLGFNYLHYRTVEDYFVFLNVASALAQTFFVRTPAAPYIDPAPLASFGKDGHNYFRSENPYRLNSGAAYGEIYYSLRPNLRLTGGLRFTIDRKSTTPVPSQLLLGDSTENGIEGANAIYGGFTARGYPREPAVRQTFRALSGRIVIDWKPTLAFTDDSLVYASYSRGYKGGGVNPPGIGANPAYLLSAFQPDRFRPEYVNALEIGTKNTLLGGRLTLDANAFGYAYRSYQVSQIVDRTAINENIDAKIWGAEIEAVWRATRRLALSFNGGYLGTRIDGGSRSIDVMNRTQGNPDWTLLKPFFQVSSNCVAPTRDVAAIVSRSSGNQAALALSALCGGSGLAGDFNPKTDAGFHWDEIYGFTYDPETDGPNGGRGFDVDLKGKQLPNSPHFTISAGATYTLPVGRWNAVFHGDVYRQTSSYARIYNTSYDRLRGWSNVDLSVTLRKQDGALAFQLYVKNVLDAAPITDAFTNSDDSGLTTNIFTLDPRIVGFNITRRF